MGYFIKKTRRSNGDLYLQIYDSYYSKEKRKNTNRSVMSLGLLSDLKKDGEDDAGCISRLTLEAKEFQRKKASEKPEKIGDEEEVFNIGYFLPKSVADSMEIGREFDLIAHGTRVRYSPWKLLCDLAFARIVEPCSKRKTVAEIFPAMYGLRPETRDQVYDGLPLLGENYKDAIEIINEGVSKIHKIDLSKVFFDCTNFYFEIDYPDQFRKPGPSKEMRPNPLVGMGLMLDRDCIPVAAEFYPGNESEKPYLPKLTDEVQRRSGNKPVHIVEVADKGLNCADNIIIAKARKNGYIFSKSMKAMSEKDYAWAFGEDGWTEVLDEQGNLKFRYKEQMVMADYSYRADDGRTVKVSLPEKRVVSYNPSLRRKQLREIAKLEEKARNASLATVRRDDMGPSAKYAKAESVDRKTGEMTGKDIVVTVNEDKLEGDRRLAGYNMLVSSEINADAREIYDVYHCLTEIEHTFRVMKSQLDARPIFMSTENSIKGHLLTCYFAVVLLRLTEKYILDGSFGIEEVIDYVKKYKIIRWTGGDYRNLILKHQAAIGDYLEEYHSLMVNNKKLRPEDLDGIMSFRCPVLSDGKAKKR